MCKEEETYSFQLVIRIRYTCSVELGSQVVGSDNIALEWYCQYNLF